MSARELEAIRSSSTLESRFAAKVSQSRNGCMLWSGALTDDGYGNIYCSGLYLATHRVAWILKHGRIPIDLLVDHTCRNRACVNADHLRLVTTKQNLENQLHSNRAHGSGYRGVSWSKRERKWKTEVMHNGKRFRAGTHDKLEEAVIAITTLRNALYTHNDADRVFL